MESSSRPVVIKYGGSLLEEPGHRTAFLREVAALSKIEKVVLVHGGGKEISRQMEQAGLTPRFVNGRRVTDDAAMAVVQKSLALLNADIVRELKGFGAEAKGFSGQENHLMEGQAIEGLGRVALPTAVQEDVLQQILTDICLPVFYSVAEDARRQALNVNADDFALALAKACRAKRLVFLTDTGGVLDKAGRLISLITPRDVDSLAAQGVITGGMLVKAKACVEALKQGVGRVDIVKGLHGEGTVFQTA